MKTDYATVRWGILGAGSIAKRFSDGVKTLRDARLIAVGSRSREKADAFAEPLGIPNRHDSYEALVNDPEVDIVYVATPHSFHKEHALLALNAGKPVLCEKPFTINAAEAEEVIRTAREKDLFLMEAMWSRFFPLMGKVRELIAAGEIGEVRMLEADFGFRAGPNPEGRLDNPALGGGALLDVGVYTVSLASMFLGTPNRVATLATLGPTGVDELSAMILGYEGGQLALLSTAIRVNTAHEATILGTAGRIRLHAPWWTPRTLTLTRGGKEDVQIEMPFPANGFQFEAVEVADCLRAGKKESDIMPLDETLSIMRTMDEIRAQWGLKYPMEHA